MEMEHLVSVERPMVIKQENNGRFTGFFDSCSATWTSGGRIKIASLLRGKPSRQHSKSESLDQGLLAIPPSRYGLKAYSCLARQRMGWS
jgi:hypothetical protein